MVRSSCTFRADHLDDTHEACRSRRFGGHQPETAKHVVFFLTEEKRPPGVVHCFYLPSFGNLYVYIFMYLLYIIYINIVWLFMPEFGKKVESGYKILDRMFDDSWNQHFWSQSSFLESAIDVPPGSRWFCSHVLSPNQKWGIHHIIHWYSNHFQVSTSSIWILFWLGGMVTMRISTKGGLLCNPLWRPPWRPWKTSSKKAAKVANSRSFPRRVEGLLVP